MNSIFKGDDWQTEIEFSDGSYAISLKQLPWGVKAVEKAHHGDVRTVSTREEFIGLEEGEEALLLDIWDNFYGRWARVQNDDGEYIDVRPKQLKVISI